MILVTRLNWSQFYVNAELVQFVESTPDTTITLVDKSKIIVSEPVEVILERLIEYRQKINMLHWPVEGQSCPASAEKVCRVEAAS